MKHGDEVYFYIGHRRYRRGSIIGIVKRNKDEMFLVRFNDGDVWAVHADFLDDGKEYKTMECPL